MPEYRDSFVINKDNIKLTSIYDRENERFVICEKTYEVQKYYVLSYDPKRVEQGLDEATKVVQYVEVQTNLGTKQVGRGKRGIEVDTKELMALRNLVHIYCPNPYKVYASDVDKDSLTPRSILLQKKPSQGHILNQKDLFVQVKPKTVIHK
jgi:hypothetical protein